METVTEMTGTAAQYADFSIQDTEGNDVAPLILESEDVILVSIYDPARLKEKDWQRIEAFAEKALAAGADLFFASSTGGEGIPAGFPFEVGYADRKLLLTINRANGGATLFSDSYIVQKWTPATMGDSQLEELLAQDGETLVVRNAIHGNVRLSGLMLGILLVLVLIYYICKISYKNSTLNKGKKKKDEN